MDAWDFTELNGVQQKGSVTVPGEPDPVMLIGEFGAGWAGRMSRDVDYRWEFLPGSGTTGR